MFCLSLVHAALNMLLIFNHIQIGVDDSEFKRAEFFDVVSEDIASDITSKTMNHEDAGFLDQS